ncbi:unnamed protein product [Withania somnifera]
MVGLWGRVSGLPCPSSELDHVAQSKEWTAWFLKRGRLREAGFTEQRTVPALSSGRITGWCLSSPVTPDGLLQLNHHFLLKT